MNLSVVKRDIEKLNTVGYFEKLRKNLKKFPITECKKCGECCYESPSALYPEFLFSFNYFMNESNLNQEQQVNILKKGAKRYFHCIISEGKDRYCQFLNDNNQCEIYQATPFNCKRWGWQSKEIFETDVKSSFLNNNYIKNEFGKQGIIVPEEVVNHTFKYCYDVKIIRDPYKFNDRDYDETMKLILSASKYIGLINMECHYSIGMYIMTLLIDMNQLGKDRLRVLKEYQEGNKLAIDEYVNSINYEDFILKWNKPNTLQK